MSKIDNGGQAFPSPSVWAGSPKEDGMSLRDWFAGQALIGFLAAGRGDSGYGEIEDADVVADYAFSQADAMLKARKGGDS